MNSHYVVLILKDELARRRTKNKSYSARAFANYLGIDASLLAKILAGHRIPTRKVIEKVEKRLSVDLGFMKHGKGVGVEELSPKKTLPLDEKTAEFFHSGWEPYAFLSRMSSGTFSGGYKELAREFALSEDKAKAIFEEVQKTGICKKDEKGVFRSEKMLVTNGELANFDLFHKNLQNKLLDKAKENLELRKKDCHFSSLTFRMSSESLALAKQLSGIFRRQTAHTLEELCDKGDEGQVYALQVIIHPLSDKK